METYYHRFYNRDLIEPHLISLNRRPASGAEYDKTVPHIPLNQSNRFEHLVSVLQDFDVIQFQGSFDPLVCEASKFVKRPHVLIEVLHNIERGGLYQEIDGIIGVSHAVQKIQQDDERCITILNGVDLDLFPFSIEQKPTDKIILLQVARRSKLAVSLEELAADLITMHPSIELWIVGDWVGESTEQVKFLGIREDVAELYRQAHFTVLLSKEEPFGLVAIESMASGTPVIVSNSGGFRDIITDSSHGFLVDRPTKEQALLVLHDAISSIKSERYKDIVEGGRRRVEQEFCIKKCVKKYEDVILKLYSEKKSSSPPALDPVTTPVAALVGEALYDLHAGEVELMSARLKVLSFSTEALKNGPILSTAHTLGAYLKFHRPDLLPRQLKLYLYCCGDRTEDTLEELLNDIELLKETGTYDHFYKYLHETREEFPERWHRLQQK
jgi:hypothetical protein